MTDTLRVRRDRVAAAWSLAGEVVLIGAGEPAPLPGGADQTYPFRSHAEYFYLADRECPGAVLAFDPQDGWTDFVPEVTEAQRVWEGATQSPGTPLTQLAGWLAARRGRTVVNLGCELPGLRSDAGRTAELREALLHARRPKDDDEIARVRRAVAATAAGFALIRDRIRPGASERQLQIELEAEFFRRGGQRTAFDTIVGAGPNSAVLHFSPTQRAVCDGDLVLVDAGAEVDRYAADVTRTYPGGGKLTGPQRELYEVVLAAQQNAIARCRPGVEWEQVHLGAARDIAGGLAAMGVLRGAADSLIEQDAHALLFPHGVGHMVGLGVRDASGFLAPRKRSTRPGLNTLRMSLPLEPGYLVTIEPGVYFIPALLNDSRRRTKYRDAVNWSRVDELLGVGGIRIEDDVLVTAGVPEVLTADIPKQAV